MAKRALAQPLIEVREPDDPPDVDAIFACRCGFGGCRGTMLWPQPAAPAVKRSLPARN